MTLIDLIHSTYATPETRQRFIERLEQGNMSRDENPESHLCVFFMPFNPQTKQVFITHHRKSGLWLPPGGHVDQGETPEQAVIRELHEELGYQAAQIPPPFILTVTEITVSATPIPCKRHYDLWYLIPTDGSSFNVDMKEFIEIRWLDIAEAKQLVSDPTTCAALERLEKGVL